MTAFRIGRRNTPFARYSLLLFEDHVEEVSYTLYGLEVKRIFFDEADFLTVHRLSSVGETFLAILAALLMGSLAYAARAEVLVLASTLGVLAVFFLAVAAYVFSFPAYQLVLAAPSPERVECRLPRRPRPREEALGRLTRAISRYQSRMSRVGSPRSAPVAPSPESASV
jgi:hypothetical protein